MTKLQQEIANTIYITKQTKRGNEKFTGNLKDWQLFLIEDALIHFKESNPDKAKLIDNTIQALYSNFAN